MTKNQKPPMYIVSLVDWLWARVVAFFLWPLHMLAEKLVHRKIRSSIGITKVVLQHSTSFSVTCFKIFLPYKQYCKTDLQSILCFLQAGVSGGGSLPMHVDKFFEVRPPILFLEIRDKCFFLHSNKVVCPYVNRLVLYAGHRCECTKWVWFDRNLTGCLCAEA